MSEPKAGPRWDQHPVGDVGPTDTERLDWIERTKGGVEWMGPEGWEACPGDEPQMGAYAETLREAIDAAMRHEREEAARG